MSSEYFPAHSPESFEPSSDWLEEFKDWYFKKEGAGIGETLKLLGDDLHEMTVGTSSFKAFDRVATNSPQVINVLSRHPAIEKQGEQLVFMNLFSEEEVPDLERIRTDTIAVITQGAVAIGLNGVLDENMTNALLFTALGADRASRLLREVMLGRRISNIDELPPLNIPLIDFEKLQRLVVWGTIRDYIQALGRHGSDQGSYAEWVSRAVAHANGITDLNPNRGCAGDAVTIRGTGFGSRPGAYTSIYFSAGADGSCIEAKVLMTPNGTPAWSDTAITVEVPEGVGIGCVGFVVFDGAPPVDPLGNYNELVGAAGMLQSVLDDAFGAAGVMFGQSVVNTVGKMGKIPSAPCPPCLPTGLGGRIPNRFVGGKPVIRNFTVNGKQSATLRANDQIMLAWDTEGADTLTITKWKAFNSVWDAFLPDVPGALPRPARGNSGPFNVPYEGVDDWDGEYVLTASNRCGTMTAFVRVEMREVPPLFGIADTHVHFLAHLAFGGYGIFGAPHASNPTLLGDDAMRDALPWCSGPNGHGAGGVLPSLEGVGGHLVGGFPEFDGWPRYSTLAHQQAYIDWIKRAVDGGLRLAVCLAVNSELLATRMTELYGSNLSIDDMSAVDRQLDAMDAMVQFIDDQFGGTGRGWMQVATSPQQAHQIIASGKLALIKGVEVDCLGGWATPAALEIDALAQGKTVRQLIVEMLEALYNKGVRHLFAIHGTNNAFGGPALFVRNYDATNFFKTGQSFTVEEAPNALGISYRLDEDEFQGGGIAEVLGYYGIKAAEDVAGSALIGLALGGLIGGPVGAASGAAAGAVISSSRYPCPPNPTNWGSTPGGHINAQGLTTYGEILIEEMMRLGMIIDIDHMGHKTTETVLQMCEAHEYPVVSGHTGFRELKYGWRPSLPKNDLQYARNGNAAQFGTKSNRLSSEVDKTPDQLRRVRLLGGMVSPITHQRDGLGCSCGNGFVLNDNAGSSKSFAQAFLYAHYHMHGRRVGLGTDINGAAQLPGPRFGPQGAVSIGKDYELGVRFRELQVFAQRDGVRYSTPIIDYRHHRFMDYGLPEAPFDAEQRDFWEAIAIWRSGNAPETAEQPPNVQRTIATKNFIINLATGLRANSRADIPIAINFPFGSRPFYNENHEEQLAAYLASHFTSDPIRPTDPVRTQQLVTKLTKVWAHWQRMEEGSVNQGADQWTQIHFGPRGSGLFDANGNLKRSTAGRRDFDINIDGMAHYGMLPDLLQDVRNVGVPVETIQTLYRSADDYVRTWQRCEYKKIP